MLYTGHYYDLSSGLYLTMYRAYSPNLARWLSRDPIGENGGINLYVYVSNNPINAVDPWGLYITYRGGGTQQFWDNYRKNYERMNSTPSGQKMLRAAECSDKNIEIGSEFPGLDLGDRIGGMTRKWPDGRIGMELNDNNLFPTRTLPHEFQHALEHAYGTPDPAGIGVQNPNDSTADGFENRGTRAATKVGQEGRDGYGPTPYNLNGRYLPEFGGGKYP